MLESGCCWGVEIEEREVKREREEDEALTVMKLAPTMSQLSDASK